LKHIIIFFINIYQAYISPYKGFQCAYAFLYGGNSCSQAIKQTLLEEGCIKGFHYSRSRFKHCKNANNILKKRRKEGACDCPLEGICECAEGCIPKQGSSILDSSCDVLPCDCSF